MFIYKFVILFFCSSVLNQLVNGQLIDTEFAPQVTATCKAGYMTIKINFNQSFVGAIHARDFRTPACMTAGNGSQIVQLGINLLAKQGQPDYCGILVHNKTEERSVPVAVRIHKTLELADDKFYVITCGKAGFKNAKNETSLVSLRLIDKDKKEKIQEAVFTHPYILQAQISRPDGTYGIRVKSCFVFNKFNNSQLLIDDRGCPVDDKIISQFKYDEVNGVADATLYSIFKLPESSEVHFQCDIGICRGACLDIKCNDPFTKTIEDSSSEGALMASTSAFILDPGQPPILSELCTSSSYPSWLLYLCITLGILFLIMLIINIFLCSAMTCACARTEIIEKEPSIIEDYDPYRSWHGSQYGSRYSLNNGGQNKGYLSNNSTMNSTRSISSHSDHYAIVHSRPGSRYGGTKHRGNGPQSNIGSHYSNK